MAPALRIAVDMLLLSAYPCALVWGPALTVIHNEPILPPSGRSHALGDSFDALWATAWDDMGAAVFQALEGQGSLARTPS
jgi:hypothetical protein